MQKKEVSVVDVLDSNTNPERIFPILNKFDRIYSHYGNKSFCEVYKIITQDKQFTDLEFTQVMEQHIEDNKIK